MTTVVPAGAVTLTWEQVVADAVAQSYEVKLARFDARLARNEVRARKVDYIPSLRTRVAVENLQDLTNGQSPTAIVGDILIPNQTRWQNAISFGFNWPLIDFGARGHLLAAARRHHDASLSVESQQLRELKLKLLDRYAETLLAFKSLKAKEQVLAISRELFEMKRRLYAAGSLSKVEVGEQALQLARTFAEVYELKHQLIEGLKNLSTFTHQDYPPEDSSVADFQDQPVFSLAALALEQTPDYRYYQLEMERKQSELKALRRQRYPQLGFYTNFYLYGFDDNDYIASLKDFRARTIAFGISATVPITDWFKNAVEQEKIRLQIGRLGVERDRKLWELREQHSKLAHAVEMYQSQQKNREGVLARRQEKLVMVERLSYEQIMAKTALLEEQTNRIEQELDLDKARIQKLASLKKLRILTEG